MLTSSEVESLNEAFAGRDPAEILRWGWERFGPRAAIGTSFQGAGLVMLHLAKIHGLGFPVFTLDTGLLFPETLALKKQLEDFFGIRIESLEPDLTVEEQTRAYGGTLWTKDPDLCCNLRKVLPLQAKLAELDCWVTGLRRQQSDTRSAIQHVERYVFDEATGREIVKLNPMAEWTQTQVWEYIREHRIPFNPLMSQGYRSIGCWPCTRKVAEGENERAGRWTGFNKAECGIHTFMAKRS